MKVGCSFVRKQNIEATNKFKQNAEVTNKEFEKSHMNTNDLTVQRSVKFSEFCDEGKLAGEVNKCLILNRPDQEIGLRLITGCQNKAIKSYTYIGCDFNSCRLIKGRP